MARLEAAENSRAQPVGARVADQVRAHPVHGKADADFGVRIGAAERAAPSRMPARLEAELTIHPSYLLRIRELDDKAREYGAFVDDLKLAAKFLKKAA